MTTWIQRALTGLLLTTAPVLGADGQMELHPSMLPVTITEPGSYLVTGELAGLDGQHGLIIAADAVHIDLNGFTLRGSPQTLHGIHVPAPCRDLRVANGIIRGWGQDGIHATNVTGGVYTDLLFCDNADTGLRSGMHGRVEACLAFHNGGVPGAPPGSPESNPEGDALHIENGSVVRACLVYANNHHAINAHSASVIESCVMRANGHDGLHGSHAMRVHGTSSCLNSEGIEVDSGSLIAASVSSDNQEDGLRIKKEENDSLYGGAVVVGSVAYHNGLLGGEDGDGGDNIDLRGPGNRVQGCVAVAGDGHGIRLHAHTTARYNLVGANSISGGDGIRIKESGCRVESNHMVSNLDDGLQASEGDFNLRGNWITRNSSFDNLDDPYNIESGNHWTEGDPAGGLPASNPAVNFAR